MVGMEGKVKAAPLHRRPSNGGNVLKTALGPPSHGDDHLMESSRTFGRTMTTHTSPRLAQEVDFRMKKHLTVVIKLGTARPVHDTKESTTENS